MSESDDLKEFTGLVGKGRSKKPFAIEFRYEFVRFENGKRVVYSLKSNELKCVVWNKAPAEVYNLIPNDIKTSVLKGTL